MPAVVHPTRPGPLARLRRRAVRALHSLHAAALRARHAQLRLAIGAAACDGTPAAAMRLQQLMTADADCALRIRQLEQLLRQP
jgi:hypothetical protein